MGQKDGPFKPRLLAQKLKELSRKFPAVTLIGPRQSGKTTLVKATFPEWSYVNLEDPDEREFAAEDPRGFLRRFSGPVILDEIQRVPKLFSYLQGIIDQNPVPGRFIFTGSGRFQLIHKIGQSLAGRSAFLTLFPFSLAELLEEHPVNPMRFDEDLPVRKPPSFSLEEILYQGLYPPIHALSLSPRDWLAAYYLTYVERDVRDILNIGNLEAFKKFIRLCAGRAAQILNLSSLASDCGISHTTARKWLSALQAGFIVHLLPAHHLNFSKRLIKSPKLYFYDTGLLCYLLGIRSAEDILIHPLRGAIFENFIFTELFKSFAHQGEDPPLYFWRDRTGHEIDFIIDLGPRLIPIETKSSETIVSDHFKNLNFYLSLKGNPTRRGVLVYGGEKGYLRKNILIRPWFSCS